MERIGSTRPADPMGRDAFHGAGESLQSGSGSQFRRTKGYGALAPGDSKERGMPKVTKATRKPAAKKAAATRAKKSANASTKTATKSAKAGAKKATKAVKKAAKSTAK